jgi:hypothetical protein
MHQAQILLNPDQHTALAEIVQSEGASISEIAHLTVQDWLNECQEEELLRRRLEDLENRD